MSAGRAIGRTLYLPVWLILALGRAVRFVIHILYDMFYWSIRFYGLPAVPVIILGVFFYVNRNVRQGATFHDMRAEIPFALLAGFVACKVIERHLRPWPHAAKKPKAAPKPKGLPVVSGASGKSDDPTEGMMIDRLPSHLQALLIPPNAPPRTQASPAEANSRAKAAE